MVVLQGAFYGMAIGAILGWMLGGTMTEGHTLASLEVQARTFGLIGGALGTLAGSGIGVVALLIRQDEEQYREEQAEDREMVERILPR